MTTPPISLIDVAAGTGGFKIIEANAGDGAAASEMRAVTGGIEAPKPNLSCRPPSLPMP